MGSVGRLYSPRTALWACGLAVFTCPRLTPSASPESQWHRFRSNSVKKENTTHHILVGKIIEMILVVSNLILR